MRQKNEPGFKLIGSIIRGRIAATGGERCGSTVEFVLLPVADYNRPLFFNDSRILKSQSAWTFSNSHAN
jgi:hypothetical protein